MIRLQYIFLLSVSLLAACGPQVSEDALIGNWEVLDVEIDFDYPDAEKDALRQAFSHASFSFKAKQEFEHIGQGAKAEGSWELDNDLLKIKTNNVGSAFTTQYTIRAIDEEEMTIRRLYEDGSGIVFKMKKMQ